MSNFVGKITVVPGSSSICSVNFSDGSNNGIYSSSTGTINLVSGGNSSFVAGASSNSSNVILDMTTHKIINVVDPTNPQDAATKNYVDTKAGTTYVAGNGLLLTGNSFSAVGSSTIISSGSGLSVNSNAVVGQPLLSSGTVGVDAAYGALALGSATSVSGTLPVNRGGTGAATFTANTLLFGNGTSAIQSSSTTVDSAGSIVMTGALRVNTRSLTSAVNITTNATDYLLNVNNTASITLTLPVSATNAGRKLVIIKTNASASNILTIVADTTLPDTINGSIASFQLTNQFSYVSLISDGVSSWYVV
jgi:hypothetical protein